MADGFPIGQRRLLDLLEGDRPDRHALIAWLDTDRGSQGSSRARYNLACYYACDDHDRALRELRIAATTRPVAAWARVDPALRPLRELPGFDRALAGVDTPRLTDLEPIRPIGTQLRDAGIYTPYQFVAQARSEADRKELATRTKITEVTLEAAARYADLALLLNGDTKTLGWLWTANIRSVCDLAHANAEELARRIAVDHLQWMAPLLELLRRYRVRAAQNGASILPGLATCPAQDELGGEALHEVHCCGDPGHHCRGAELHHVAHHQQRRWRCWIDPFDPGRRRPRTWHGPAGHGRPPDQPLVACAHPRKIEASAAEPTRPTTTPILPPLAHPPDPTSGARNRECCCHSCNCWV